jgi:hypothetical protein
MVARVWLIPESSGSFPAKSVLTLPALVLQRAAFPPSLGVLGFGDSCSDWRDLR